MRCGKANLAHLGDQRKGLLLVSKREGINFLFHLLSLLTFDLRVVEKSEELKLKGEVILCLLVDGIQDFLLLIFFFDVFLNVGVDLLFAIYINTLSSIMTYGSFFRLGGHIFFFYYFYTLNYADSMPFLSVLELLNMIAI